MNFITICSLILAILSIITLIAVVLYFQKRNTADSNNYKLEEARLRELQLTNERLLNRMNEATANLTSASATALQDNSRTLLTDNARQLNDILTPLRQQIQSFDKSVRDSYINDNATRMALKQQIDNLIGLNNSLTQEAHNLANALRGNSKVQGDWGEAVLVSMLEKAGLKNGVNFETQPASDDDGNALRNEDNKLQRPDVVVYLPDGVKLIIDSKVSLTAYTDICANPEPDKLKEAQKRHVQSVRKHIDELARKKYQDTVNNAIPQVLMFIPNDGAFSMAMQLDSSLYEYAESHRVSIVSPTHLYSVMILVTQLWKRENQNRNAEQIAKLAGLLFDKFVDFTNELDKIQTQLDNAQGALSNARRHLTQGSTSIVSRAQRLRDMGAKANKSLSSKILEQTSE